MLNISTSGGEASPLPGDLPFEYIARAYAAKLSLGTVIAPLLKPGDIDRYSLGDAPNTVVSRGLEQALQYLRGFVSQPHPHLGREGPVCPFTERGLSKNLIQFSPFLGEPTLPNIVTAMTNLGKQFDSMAQQAGRDRLYLSLLLVFPEMTESEFPLIDSAQNELKAAFVKKGLMVGQFHYNCKEGGVCNAQFRPLRSPVPMLALRHMTPGDIVFLDGDRDYMQAYTERFRRSAIPKPLLKRFDEALTKFNLLAME